ncbi:MAG: GNAT family N-acetyltransferase [Spirochaetota bacterium]
MNKIKLSIKKARHSDIEAIYIIEKDSIGLWTINQFYSELACSFSVFLVARVNEEIAAYIVAWRITEELQINSIAVKSKFRGMNIGKTLIDEAVKLHNDYKPEKIVLEVAEKNTQAVLFYLKNGFIKTGLRKNFYINDNAILMEKKL